MEILLTYFIILLRDEAMVSKAHEEREWLCYCTCNLHLIFFEEPENELIEKLLLWVLVLQVLIACEHPEKQRHSVK